MHSCEDELNLHLMASRRSIPAQQLQGPRVQEGRGATYNIIRVGQAKERQKRKAGPCPALFVCM